MKGIYSMCWKPLKMDIKTHDHSKKNIISVKNIAKWHNTHFKLLIILLLFPSKEFEKSNATYTQK